MKKGALGHLTFPVCQLFKGGAGLVTRKLLSDPERLWIGTDLAKKLGMSQAWVNRVLSALQSCGFVARKGMGPGTSSQLIKPKELLLKWAHSYSINQNTYYFYLQIKKNPLHILKAAAKNLDFDFALTGYSAANLIQSKTMFDFPAMIYLWPKSPEAFRFKEIRRKLENVYHFIPVSKDANVIVLKPIHNKEVFFAGIQIKNIPIVSPVQLFLDLYSLDRGSYVVSQLESFWSQHGMSYVL